MSPFRWGLLAAVLAQAACSAAPAPHAAQPLVPVQTAIVRRSPLTSASEFSGTLAAVRSTTVGAMTEGRIVAMDVRVGDVVHAGQPIAEVDSSQYQAQLSQAQAGEQSAAQNAQAALAGEAEARSRLTLARATARRMDELYREGAISAEQHDQSQADLGTALAALNQAGAAVSAARSTAVQAQAGIASAAVPVTQAGIAAPFSGVITQTFVEPGAVVAPGAPIAALQDLRDLELTVAVPEDIASQVHRAAPVQIRVDALGNLSIPGYIRAIVPSDNPALRSVTLKIAVAPRPGLIAGMFARVELSKHAAAAWVVPVQAVVSREGQTGVFEVRGGIATFVPVTTGGTSAGDVAVDGIGGMHTRVAVTNLQRLTDGTRVRAQQ